MYTYICRYIYIYYNICILYGYGVYGCDWMNVYVYRIWEKYVTFITFYIYSIHTFIYKYSA